MKKSHLIITVIVIVSMITGCKKKEADTIQISSMLGEVKLIAENKQEFTPQVGDILKNGDTITTGSRSIADIMFGEYGIIRIQAESTVVMASLLDEKTGNTNLEMNSGKLYVTLSKLKKGSFNVKTPTAVASVRGTSFRVTADAASSRLDVVNGSVTINPVQNNTIITDIEQTVETNQTVRIDEKDVKEKKGIAVENLKPEEIREIRDEVKDIKPELIDRLKEEARKEIKEKVLEKKTENESEATQKKQSAPPVPVILKQKQIVPKEADLKEQKEAVDQNKKLHVPDGPTTL